MLHPILLRLSLRWRWFVLVLTPAALLPLLFVIGTNEAKCGFVLLIVTIFWMTEVVPLAITSLLPVVLFPFLGILTTDQVCRNYMKETNMLLLTGIVAAIAVEESNLHRRIALRILLLMGGSINWIVLGFMLTTMFLSMWISNTAATAMMVPIAESILNGLFVAESAEMKASGAISSQVSQQSLEVSTIRPSVQMERSIENLMRSDDLEAGSIRKASLSRERQRSQIRKCILLSVAYAANLGGTGTLTGTGPNLVLAETLQTLYGDKSGVNFATWMMFSVPGMILAVLLAWIWLQLYFLGPRQMCQRRVKDEGKVTRLMIQKQYDDMGLMTFREMVVLVLFTILVLLWVFRDPKFIPGWASAIPQGKLKDSVAGVAIVFLMFVWPSTPDWFCFNLTDRRFDQPPAPVLTWAAVHKKMPWNILLLLGGGFALADATKVSGLSIWLGDQLTILKDLDTVVMVTLVATMTALLTEVASNAAAASILLPVLADMARAIDLHPLYLMLPATISCSFAFMLPIATPPNAIVFEKSTMKISDMIKPGFVMNIICVGVVVLMINTLGVFMFDLNSNSKWMEQINANVTLR